MIKTLSFFNFVDEFRNMGRDNQFTYNQLRGLYDYLESFEEDTGEKIELNVIALCCDYTGYDCNEIEDLLKERELKTVEDLQEYTTVIECENGEYVIADY